MDVIAKQQSLDGWPTLLDRARIALGVLRSATRHTLRPDPTPAPTDPGEIELQLLADNQPLSPDDSPENDAPPPPPAPPKKSRKSPALY